MWWHAISNMHTPDFRARRPTNLHVISLDYPLPITRALTLRDVKNETTSGDVYENTGDDDKMSVQITGFYTKMHESHDHRQQSVGFIDGKYQGCTLKRDAKRQGVHRLLGVLVQQNVTAGDRPRERDVNLCRWKPEYV